MVWRLKLVPQQTNLPFMALRRITYPLSIIASIAAIGLFISIGLNTGIDFRGGTMIEVRDLSGPAEIADYRATLGALDLGDVQIQEFGQPSDLLIRIERQPGGEEAQQAVVSLVKEALGEGVEYRRVEVVGPRVSGELTRSGLYAVLAALIGILIYIWFRFEWQFAIGAIIATLHDVIMTIGFFAITRIDFDLSSIAAVLAIIGYSLNDTVIVYDRIRENLRKYKKMATTDLLDLSINNTLSRTVMTSLTTLLALLALFFFGGEVIRSFTSAMIFGVLIGTYSSIFIAAPVLMLLGIRREGVGAARAAAENA